MDNSPAEKRKCKRYNVTDFIVAVYANRLGRVINISENGLAIKLIDTDFESLPEECKISLLTRARGFLIEELSLKLVRKEVISSTSSNNAKMQTIGVKFNISDAFQLFKIKQYLFYCPNVKISLIYLKGRVVHLALLFLMVSPP